MAQLPDPRPTLMNLEDKKISPNRLELEEAEEEVVEEQGLKMPESLKERVTAGAFWGLSKNNLLRMGKANGVMLFFYYLTTFQMMCHVVGLAFRCGYVFEDACLMCFAGEAVILGCGHPSCCRACMPFLVDPARCRHCGKSVLAPDWKRMSLLNLNGNEIDAAGHEAVEEVNDNEFFTHGDEHGGVACVEILHLKIKCPNQTAAEKVLQKDVANLSIPTIIWILEKNSLCTEEERNEEIPEIILRDMLLSTVIMRSKKFCNVCNRRLRVQLQACGHSAACIECVTARNGCPVCRRPLSGMIPHVRLENVPYSPHLFEQ